MATEEEGFSDAIIVGVSILGFLIVVIIVLIFLVYVFRDKIPFLSNKVSEEEKTHASRFGENKLVHETHNVKDLRKKRGLPPLDSNLYLRKYNEKLESEVYSVPSKLEPIERVEKPRRKKKARKAQPVPLPQRHATAEPGYSTEDAYSKDSIVPPSSTKASQISPNFMEDDEESLDVSANGDARRYRDSHA